MADRYVRRLERDVARWVERGWVAPEHAGPILADAAGTRSGQGIGLFLLFGAAFVGIGVLLLVAANWAGLGKWVKIALLVAGIAAAYGAAWHTQARGLVRTSQALYVVGVLVFGASVMLVGQIYHAPPNTAGFLLTWIIGALATAILAPSQPALVLALGIGVAWVAEEGSVLPRGVDPSSWARLAFPAIWIFAAALAAGQRWRVAGWFLVPALAAWWIFAGAEALGFVAWLRWGVVLALGVAVAGASAPDFGAVGRTVRDHALVALAVVGNLLFWPDFAETGGAQGWDASIALAATAAAAALLWRRVLPPWALAGLIVLALHIAALPLWNDAAWFAVGNVLLLACLTGAAVAGERPDGRRVGNLALGLLAVTVLRLYVTTFWDLADRGLFFLGGGLLILLLGGWIERRRRRRAPA